ncbi:hypothetical protein [Lederbergia citrisecunda]|nr:hypothetical protein [Lederbergia citrisecunda]
MFTWIINLFMGKSNTNTSFLEDYFEEFEKCDEDLYYDMYFYY